MDEITMTERILEHLQTLEEVPTKIFLIGLPACGKSKNGKRLAKELNYVFVDADNYIEIKENKTIKEIFATKGEEHFRQLEQKYLYEMANLDNVIIATGGGMPCFFDNMAFMNKKGHTVWLNVSIDYVAERLILKRNKRPMTIGKTDKEIKKLVADLYQKRSAFFEKAKAIIR